MMKDKELKPVRYAYAVTSALLLGGAAVSLATGQPAGAQAVQAEPTRAGGVVPRAGAPGSFAELTEQVQPAVVNISTKQRVEVNANPFAGTPFADLFNQRGGGQPQTRRGQSLGSGFIISSDGYVVTNNHVVSPEQRAVVEEITVTLPDGTEYEAELVGKDAASDLAVLKINAGKALPYVNFGDSQNARVGDWVLAIGNPFGLGGTVTSGIISSVIRNTGGGAYDRYIQTDASINRGNSGGPLFDMRGNVIGINNAIYSPTGGNVGIGFAIPADIAAPIVDQLRKGQEVQRGYIGVSIQTMNDDLASSLGLQKGRGEFVQMVQPDGPADKAGIEPGDVVLKVNGRDVTKDQTLSYLVANISPGTRIPLEIYRDGQKRNVTIKVDKRPSEEELARAQQFAPNQDDDDDETRAPVGASLSEGLGVQVVPMTPQIARQLGVGTSTKGLVVGQVAPGSDAADKGLRRGDIILSANNRKVASPEELNSVIEQVKKTGREAVLLRVQRRGGPSQFVAVRIR